MTYSPIQLEVIRVFGRKELSKGLLYNYKLGNFEMLDYNNSISIPDGVGKYFHTVFPNTIPIIDDKEYEILGHIPHLEDVLRTAKDKFADMDIHMTHLVFFDRNPMDMNTSEGVDMIEYNQYVPLIEQPESVLIELLNLFK